MTSKGVRSGYAGGVGQGLSRGPEQDRHEASARHAGGGRELTRTELLIERKTRRPQRRVLRCELKSAMPRSLCYAGGDPVMPKKPMNVRYLPVAIAASHGVRSSSPGAAAADDI